MILQIRIEMDNAAFADANGFEAARILRQVAERIEARDIKPEDTGPLHDANGNRVGSWHVTGEAS